MDWFSLPTRAGTGLARVLAASYYACFATIRQDGIGQSRGPSRRDRGSKAGVCRSLLHPVVSADVLSLGRLEVKKLKLSYLAARLLPNAFR